MISIIMFTKDDSLYKIIKNTLFMHNYDVLMGDPENIILDICKYEIKFIILDMDFCDTMVLNTLKDFREVDYVPMVGIYSNSYTIDKNIGAFIKFLIPKSKLDSSLIGVLNNLMELKDNYDLVKQSNEAIEMITNEIDRLFRFNSYSVSSLLQNTFSLNNFLLNKPSIVLIFDIENNETKIHMYRNINGITVHDKPLERNDILDFEKEFSIETEFYCNCNLKQFSDMDNYKYILLRLLEGRVDHITNFTGYASTRTAVIAINYIANVKSLDAKIIKSLCINLNLISSVYDKVNEVNQAFIYTIGALARAGEAADDDTGSHIMRVNEYSKLISEKLGMSSNFNDEIYFSAQLHDVGKIHIPHSILKKNGALTKEEFDTMKEHTVYGPKIIGSSPNLQLASEIALNHHEKFDGSGYPYGLAGESIPISARIVTIADIYDALRSPRVYKPSLSHDRAVEIITIGDSRVMPSHFDPNVLEQFIRAKSTFNEIWNTYK